MSRRRATHTTVMSILSVAIAAGSASAQPLALTRQNVSSHAGARGLVAADFDRDGWMDLAHANTGRNTVTILINQGGSARSFVPAYDVAVGLGPFELGDAADHPLRQGGDLGRGDRMVKRLGVDVRRCVQRPHQIELLPLGP